MEYRRFGNCGFEVSRIGLGCYGMSGAYGAADDDESIATIHRAIDLGVTLLDTSASYGQGHNHDLIRRALRGKRDKVVIHSKTGTIRGPDGRAMPEGSGAPERLRRVCEQSLARLGVETIDIFCLSRVDPSVPIEESVGAMAELVEAGKARFVGLSEAAPATLRRASRRHALASLQSEYSLWSRDPEDGQIDACRELDLAFMAYAPLGYGFLTGALADPDALPEADSRRRFPRFQAENFAANRDRVAAVEAVARELGRSAAQVALAWLLSRGDDVFPIPGAKSRGHLEENVEALAIALTPAQMSRLDRAFPKGSAAGERYPAAAMRNVNL